MIQVKPTLVFDIAHKMDIHADQVRAIADNLMDLGRRLQKTAPKLAAMLPLLGIDAADLRDRSRKINGQADRIRATDPEREKAS